MLAARTTLLHFSVSSARNRSNVAGELVKWHTTEVGEAFENILLWLKGEAVCLRGTRLASVTAKSASTRSGHCSSNSRSFVRWRIGLNDDKRNRVSFREQINDRRQEAGCDKFRAADSDFSSIGFAQKLNIADTLTQFVERGATPRQQGVSHSRQFNTTRAQLKQSQSLGRGRLHHSRMLDRYRMAKQAGDCATKGGWVIDRARWLGGCLTS
jgi:hypothetical protein